MVHVARRVLGAIVVLAIVAGATLALSSRPRLKTDRETVERNWSAVHGGLALRYTRVDQLARAIDATGGPPNPLVDETKTAYAAWQALKPDAPVATWIATANTLEGLNRRLAATVAAAPVLKADPQVAAALRNVNAAPIPPGVAALNESIARYEKDRGGPLLRLVAGPLGYDAIPRLALQTVV